ncbi:Uncharacterized membrane protein [Ectothiorhodosinus mongolicus]|uniref:Uncharacterized membrane protein n=1 Tax=Ectothiorhodosinus mongolicus TaxID=233100 RepID=A0A1R3VLY9_9GAMM|nr:NnrU family protein [Ectothiorhodosinus mongolicus]ULX57741.1 hypothetical protein CKX93_08800 [Ectothiorhodosinus mongolicus]SIT65599.1 Uncharacterized membrane protein [Ectothiorhodosinus mongolicus]
MSLLIIGLILFLGMHSMRFVAPGVRQNVIDKAGDKAWIGIASIVSLVGLYLIVQGYGTARLEPFWLQRIWMSPPWTAHVAALFMLVAFIILAAAFVPNNHIKAMFGHPMVISVKVWAIAHLFANGTRADVILFGAFLIWSVLSFRAARQRDKAEGVVRAPGRGGMTALTVVVGVAAYLVFAFYLHMLLIGRGVTLG